MMLSKDAIADVIEALRGTDFYRPTHEQIYDAIIDLYGRGEPADAVTVSAELGKRGELLRIGGAPYLHDLLSSVPLAANAGFYADIVREKAILRRLVDASVRIDQMSYAGEGEVNEIVDRAQAEVYAVTDRRAAEDYKPLSELMQPTMDEMEAISSRDGSFAGVPTGFAELDELTNGLHPGQMVIVAARPGCGKSTLALDLARSASIKKGLTSVIFSLEMSQIEITMRLLSAEASIPLGHIRGGRMSDDDWSRVALEDGTGLGGARSTSTTRPNLTMMEIRAKARRLKQRHDLRLVVIDYIQLMTSGQEGRVPSAGGERVQPPDQAAGQGARGAGGRVVPAQPRTGAAHGQAADAVRPPRVGLVGAGRRHGRPAEPSGPLRQGVRSRR